MKICKKNTLKVLLFMKNGDVNTIEKETWLTSEQLELETRKMFDSEPEECNLVDYFSIEEVTS